MSPKKFIMIIYSTNLMILSFIFCMILVFYINLVKVEIVWLLEKWELQGVVHFDIGDFFLWYDIEDY
jgi:hypothetical protein